MSSLFANSAVIELTPKNFSANGRISHPSLDGTTKGLLIYAVKWCGFCQKAKPDYIKTANALGKAFPLFSLDCEKYPELAKTMGVKSFPTIRFINKNGSLGKPFTGNRTVEGFLGAICTEGSVCK